MTILTWLCNWRFYLEIMLFFIYFSVIIIIIIIIIFNIIIILIIICVWGIPRMCFGVLSGVFPVFFSPFTGDCRRVGGSGEMEASWKKVGEKWRIITYFLLYLHEIKGIFKPLFFFFFFLEEIKYFIFPKMKYMGILINTK